MDKPSPPFASGSPRRRRRPRLPERALRGAAICAIAVEALWYGIHEVRGFGPALADGARAVVGPAPVAWAEDVAYGIADRLNRALYRHAAPKTFWEPPPAAAAEAERRGERRAAEPASPPSSFEPPFPQVAATGDGVWTPIADPARPDDAPVLWKSVVHPDKRRVFAAVAVVAIDLERVDLQLVAGTKEPFSPDIPIERRPGVVPEDHAGDLIAAFNGGFKAMHGHYGMMLDGDTFLPPRDKACTIALYRNGAVRIRTWPELRADEARMAAYRQTPPCLVEQGEPHQALYDSNRDWGATVSGETVIRRSALGVDATGKRLFYGLGEAVTARTLAHGMKAAGAHDVAELDVNHAYPRFLLYDRAADGAAPRATSAIIPDVEYKPEEYVAEPSPRDFFYLRRRRPDS
ncbi:phosphodiester glycosidase family protein [Sorangium cellulosum]|uniref:phosphodiester glycosidase family protein n=1 Tax=Sorangium TaxID=39643 RepID=UPI000A82ED3D|nr:phosphodiester glycosidase family protein [Sorangium cellulosum]